MKLDESNEVEFWAGMIRENDQLAGLTPDEKEVDAETGDAEVKEAYLPADAGKFLTVGGIKKALKSYDDDMKVIMANDAADKYVITNMDVVPTDDGEDIVAVDIDTIDNESDNEKEDKKEEKINEVSTGHRNDEDPTMAGKMKFKDYRYAIKNGKYEELLGVKDIGDELKLFVSALKDSNNIDYVLDAMDEDEILTIFSTILDNCDDTIFDETFKKMI